LCAIAEIHVYKVDLPVSGKPYRMSEGTYAILAIYVYDHADFESVVSSVVASDVCAGAC
jgi:hypothetical protein